jgi:DNA damage-inducible protein 1
VNAPEQQKDGDILNLELPEGMTVKDLKGIVESDTGFPAQLQQFYLNGRPLSDELQTLEAAGIRDNEMLAMLIPRPAPTGHVERRQQGGNAGRRELSSDEIETVRLQVLGNPQLLQELRSRNPVLADAINDSARFKRVWDQKKQEDAAREQERQNQIRLLNEDPFNVDAQRKIEEMIRQDNVMENLQHAYENNPEGE